MANNPTEADNEAAKALRPYLKYAGHREHGGDDHLVAAIIAKHMAKERELSQECQKFIDGIRIDMGDMLSAADKIGIKHSCIMQIVPPPPRKTEEPEA